MPIICVYCGSRPGADPEYQLAARQLGYAIAAAGAELVYGGASLGLMGGVADAALERGARVTGIIPGHLEQEAAHRGLSRLHIVENMHARKKMMLDMADAVIAMPGGFGTLEEIFEALAWRQLRLHSKPCGLLNVRGFYSPLIAFLDHAVGEGFLDPRHRALIFAGNSPETLLEQLLNCHFDSGK